MSRQLARILGALADDIRLGESHRGLQDEGIGDDEILGAIQQLKGSLRSLGASRASRHAPLVKDLHSPYKDSKQISMTARGVFTPANFSLDGPLPVISGKTRVYKKFKPEKAVVTEMLSVVWSASGQDDRTVFAAVTDAADVVLVTAFSGADNCFPNAPDEDSGISGSVFSNVSLGVGISWPTINGGIDFSGGFAVEPSILARTADPFGGDGTISSVSVKVRFALLGPALR